ncbi:MAG: hypothetical protein CBD58_00280 [bacterium TMED198]|nr:MAG: hypothetical protein CBD58_00280 [bacterium TMED198]|tara:strand:+ start:2061 stop:2696 length:636 start_codon:yes stop_codon:yes gene_type:complete
MIIRKIFITVIAISSMLVSKEIDTEKDIFKVGIGLEFDLFATTNLISSNRASLYIPVHIKKVFVETEFTFFSESNEGINSTNSNYSSSLDRKTEETGIGLAIGFYNVIEFDSMNMYSGLKLGYSSYEMSSNYSYYDNRLEENIATVAFSPVLGSEYFISDNFTIGGEVSLKYSHSKTNAILAYYDEGSSIVVSGKKTETFFIPKFMIRYYF